MVWVILEMETSKKVLITSEGSMQAALDWIDSVLPGCAGPIWIELLDSQQAGGVHIEIDEGGIRAMRAR